MKRTLFLISLIGAICGFSFPAFATTPTPTVTPTPQITPASPLYGTARPMISVAPPAMQSASATGSAGAAVTLELPAMAGMTTQLYGFDLTCTNPTAVESGALTITGAAGQTLNYEVVEASATGANLDRHFAPLPAASSGSIITISLAAISGGGSCAINAEYGFAD